MCCFASEFIFASLATINPVDATPRREDVALGSGKRFTGITEEVNKYGRNS